MGQYPARKYCSVWNEVWFGIGSSGTINNGTSNPPSATVGELFFNTTDDKLYVWNGSAWVDVT